jgi:NAD+ synthase
MIDLNLPNPQKSITQIVAFIRQTYERAGKKQGVIAVSGGIDSAVSLTLLCEALDPKNVWVLFLPYKDQSIQDSQAIAAVNRVPKSHWRTISIDPIVAGFEQAVQQGRSDQISSLRLGNGMARARMMVLFDVAKELDALVCGTENKSEKYLAYFTRFGDEASDLEPIHHLYKTQIRQLAKELNLPEQFITKPPSAGLWAQQTDEQEFGFSYQDADKVIEAYIKEAGSVENITQLLATTISQHTNIALPTVEAVLQRVKNYDFKHHVPYVFEENQR